MAEYRLYCFAQSGNAYKAALALELAGADWEPRFVDFFKGEARSPEYRAVNVMGEVPVLEHKGLRLTQSGVILDYLAGELDRFGPENDAERREILRWILFDNHKFTSYFATYRFLKALAKTGDPAVVEFLGQRARAAYAILDAHLKGRDFVAADRPTIADLSLAGYVYFAEEGGFDLDAEFPQIAAWAGRIAALPGWKHPYELMPGHPLPS